MLGRWRHGSASEPHLLIEGDGGHGGVQLEHLQAEQRLHAQGQAVHVPRHGPHCTRDWMGREQTPTLSRWMCQTPSHPSAQPRWAEQAMRGVSDGLQAGLCCLRFSSGLQEDIRLSTGYRENEFIIRVPARMPLTGPVTPDRLWEKKKKYIVVSVMGKYFQCV